MEVAKKADIVWHPHPVTPIAGREVKYCAVTDSTPIRQVLIAAGIDQKQPLVIYVDDKPLKVAEWDSYIPKNGEIINVQAVVNGGGGGGGGSNPIAMVAQIALIVAVSYFTMGAGASMIGLTAGSMGAMAAGAAMMIGGSMLISTMFPPRMPSMDGGIATGSMRETSPTYSLSGGSNSARPYQSMPVVMGRHRIFPDMGARPFTEYQGTDQFLYQIFNLGLSDLTVSDWMIGTNPISNFKDFSFQPTDSDGRMKYFPSNVSTVQGAAITASAGWITRTSSANCYRLGVDVEATCYYANNSGGLDGNSVSFAIHYKRVEDSNWTDYGVQTISGASQSPIRRSFYINLPSVGTYDVRILRTSGESTDPRRQDKANWSSLRSYQLDNATYHGQNRIGISIRASEQLSGAIQQMSVLASAKARYLNSLGNPVYGETSNPAHWFTDFALGRYNADGVLLYGVGLSVNQLDVGQINEWAKFCSDEGLTFNAVIDGQQSAADILSAIARAGFGSASWASGKLGVVWDGRNQPAVAAFGMSNIIKGTFEVSYITEQLAEEIIVRYRNPAKDWNQDEVRVLAPGITNPQRSSSVDLFGCVDQKMAGKMANYLAAQQYYRKRRITWETDSEGFVCQRGDVVLLSHDLTQWGYSGRIVEANGNQITLDRKVPRSGKKETLMIKSPDGTMTYHSVMFSGDSESSILDSDDIITLQPGTLPFDSMWFFSPLATTGKKVKILSVQPVSETRLKIIATDENPEFYGAWDGTFIAPERDNVLPNPQVPSIINLRIEERLASVSGSLIVTRVSLLWDTNVSQIDRVNIRYRINGGDWTTATSYGSQMYEFDIDGYGQLEVTAVPVNGINVGASVSASAYVYGKSLPPKDVTGFTSTLDANNGIKLTWNPNPDIDIDSYEIRHGVNWDASTLVATTKSTQLEIGRMPSGYHTWLIKAVDTSGNHSDNFAEAGQYVYVAPEPTVSGQFVGNNLVLSWNAVQGSFATQLYSVGYGERSDGITEVSSIKGTTFSLKAQFGGTRRFWVSGIDLNGSRGVAGSFDAVVVPPSAVSINYEVIDNNVLLRWGNATSTLPIEHYEVRRGAIWSEADVIGSVSAQFSTIFETKSGLFTYWVAGVDSAGNYGTPTDVLVKVDSPPNYQLLYDRDSDFSGTRVNISVVDGVLTLPIDTTSTWSQHFEDHGWVTIKDQIDAGFPYFSQPTADSGYYEEEFDYGAILPSTRIVFTSQIKTSSQDRSAYKTILSVKADAADPWIDYEDVDSVFASNFRYVKMRVEAHSPDGTSIVSLRGINIKFDVKLSNEAGTKDVKASDPNGTQISFDTKFIDVRSISVTPQGTTPMYAVYDFKRVPYPQSFSVYLYDINGNRVSGAVSWSCIGV